MYVCISFLAQQWKWSVKWAITCFSLTFLYVNIQATLSPSCLLISTEGLLYLFFSFHVIVFHVNGWLTRGSNGSRKGYDVVPCSFAFLCGPALFQCLKQVLVQMESMILSCQCLYFNKDVTRLPLIGFEPHWTPVQREPRDILCLWALQCSVNGAVRNGGQTCCSCVLCSWAGPHGPLDLTYKRELQR